MRKAIVLFLFLLAVSFCVIGQTEHPAEPLPGLKAEVSVRRDGRDIPYIRAANDSDLYFTQGYETARDRLWQMDLMRRLARGETAELFGKLALDQDKRWRRFNFSAVAEQSFQYHSPQLRAALEDYARGVNAYIATLNDKTMPPEFRILQYKPREWRPTDSLVIGKILADALSTTWQNDLLRSRLIKMDPVKFAELNNQATKYDVILYGKDLTISQIQNPELQFQSQQPVTQGQNDVAVHIDKEIQIRKLSLEMVGVYAEELSASNNWVISGKHTADGKALLANDPHLAATAPGIWYLASIQSPSVHAAGVTIPGIPGIILGHNETIAWGATNVGPDVQDLYSETIEGDAASGGSKYRTPTGLEPLKLRNETINLRSNPLKPDTVPVEFAVQETRNGPIIVSENGKNYSLKWTALDPKNMEFEAFFQLNRAANWQDFQNALKTYGGSTQNFVYADVKGNIGWYAAGKIPLRKKGEGALPYEGTADDGEWTGYIPFAELPHLYNPSSGLIVTANQRTIGSDYKYPQFARDVAMPWRARRIVDRLSGKKNLTMDDVRDTQLDDYNMPLSIFAKSFIETGAGSVETKEVIKAWDGKMTADSRALLVNELRNCVSNKIADSNKPAPAWLIRERVLTTAVEGYLRRWLPEGAADWGAAFNSCDSDVRADLAKRYGADPTQWVWGKFFLSRFAHPLAGVPLIGGQFMAPSVGINGSGQTPNVGSSVSMRLIASPGNWDATRHVIPLGESGNPASTHFKDQFELWKSGAPAVFPFTEKAVAAATVTTATYKP